MEIKRWIGTIISLGLTECLIRLEIEIRCIDG